ncbi:NACHT domain family [Richelia sinica FACHB-800]|uniref:NACHT domain family n=2 Tax=Richelia TaxID=98443 RepID=A0A975T949_9NOST|nr:NACHT domain-containing protein [Richelia sinica]MBD2667466.1 NACHT domain-containing protein [Richelia sinica FACHB-800]QXE23636.1 NACHT domain family [Richelia sinica FACHB-800]
MPLPEDFLKQLQQYSELSNREKEVFIEIFGRGKSRVQVAQTLSISESNVSTCLSGIYKKFQITGSGPVKETRLREYLGKRYSQQKPPVNADVVDSEIDALVQEIRALVKPHIKEKCGTMRVLDMEQRIELTGERGIYTNVNILEKLNRNRRIEIAELLKNCNPEEFDRFGLSKVTEKRIPGLEAVQRHSKLMVLGKPGAGKTTFLKYLAMHCIEGEFLTNKVPFFITLKEFAEKPKQPDLLEYIAQQLSACRVKDAEDKIDKILSQDRGLILLDGLDEVRAEDTNRVLNQIIDISTKYHTNQFVITCRIAAKEYTFERFTEVEMADFNKQQIATFAQNWFRLIDPVKADRFIQRLKENEPIYELATNPLLLTLLCLVFGENNDFPANRSELYKEGVDILLKKWDAKRNIERDQVYKNLSLHRKEDLLSQIAQITFEQGNYFFKQKMVEGYIADFIYNLRDARTEPQELELDSEAVLKSIESQHGLLVARANGIYSFSHLTFQEYFTAREIVANSSYEILMEYITETRWQEVFLLTVGMMRKADDLILLMKQKIDMLVGSDEKYQKLLIEVNIKSNYLEVKCRKASLRAFYFWIEANYLFESIIIDNNILVPTLSWKIDKRIGDYENINIILNIFFKLARKLLKVDYSNNYFTDIHELCLHYLPRVYEAIISGEFDHKIKNDLKNIWLQLPYEEIKIKNKFLEWRIYHGMSWIEKLESVLIQYIDIGCSWQFNEAQKELLERYYKANRLLINCLNSDCYVSREVREYIEDTLLLPMSEIEKIKKQ